MSALDDYMTIKQMAERLGISYSFAFHVVDRLREKIGARRVGNVVVVPVAAVEVIAAKSGAYGWVRELESNGHFDEGDGLVRGVVGQIAALERDLAPLLAEDLPPNEALLLSKALADLDSAADYLGLLAERMEVA